MPTKVLFVCLGNICRSPTAHGILQHKIKALGLDKRFYVDSAGTAGWHAGKAPDARTISAARARGYDVSTLSARQVIGEDFAEFDIILAMDRQNLAFLHDLKPAHFVGHLGLFLDFHPSQPLREMPDPYYGDAAGFHQVVDLVEASCDGLIAHLLARE